MSLLMQALKKAERAKQNHLPEEEPTKPSEAFDQVLELAPQEPARADALSLAPIDETGPGAELEFAPREEETAAHLIEPASAPPVAPAPAPAVAAPPPSEPAQGSAPEAPPRRARNAPPPPPPPRVRPKHRAMPYLTARTMRLAALGGGVLIVAGLFGYMYWNAMYGSGSSRHLAPVPMPGQNLPPGVGPTSGAAVVVPPELAGAALPPDALPPGAASPGIAAAQPYAAVPPAASAPAAPPVAAAPAPAPAPAPAASRSGPPDSRSSMPPDMYMQGPPAQASGGAPSVPSGAVLGAADNANIRVARASVPGQVNPALQTGFAAVQQGDLDGARQQYQSVLREDGNNRDALLGLAFVSVREGRPDQAGALYGRLLDIDPNDSDALAGLAGLRAGDPAQLESRLRHALERHPDSGALLFALGNLYARQQRWGEAQQHYFRAYTAAPTNPDYAFNLAVGLDRLNQPKLALTYYQRALEAAGPVNFDRAAVTQRVRELATPQGQ
ncbi:MAG: tetratricopeptide repeat protein [Gammaproteobacteria bacterium]